MCKSMKNKLATYLLLMIAAFTVSSCFNDPDEYEPSPYAYIESFSVGDIKCKYPAFTSTGADTTVTKTISGAAYPFTINQAAGEIYNNDSLPFATDVTKIVMKMSVQGVAGIYVDSLGDYETFSSSDSIDFTSPRKFRVYSIGGKYYKDYTVSVNVHQVNPDLMVWDSCASPASFVAVKAIAFGDDMLLFGKDADGNNAVASTPMAGTMGWSVGTANAPQDIDFSTMQLFDGRLYAVAGGDLYVSADAVEWSAASQGNGLVALIGASDEDGYLWAATSENICRTADGVAFETVCALPDGFPLYGISTSSYALSHNRNIIRYMLVGYDNAAEDGDPQVWSMLSNEDAWTRYYNAGSPYQCPALKGLAVLRYGDLLYALGGKGVADGVEVEAFSKFFVSRDNGIVWKAQTGYYQLPPKSLMGSDAPFVAAVDTQNHMWIVTCGEGAMTWRGVINSLCFED